MTEPNDFVDDMELGNALFGNSRGQARLPREADWQQPFLELLTQCGLDRHCFGQDGARGFENDVFRIEPYFWDDCECPGTDDDIHLENCPERVPNFLHKPSGFRIEWYKYPFRDAYMTPSVALQRWLEIVGECCASLGDQSTEPI